MPATKVWVTDFRKHPFHIEWLRFEPDTPVTGPVRHMPHVAFRVDSIREAAKGLKVLLEPFDAGIAVVGFYETAGRRRRGVHGIPEGPLRRRE